MSIIPMRFRDWWDEWDTPRHSSRLLDQQFGTGLRRDDLLSSFWNAPSTSLRSGYVRPWKNQDLQRQESGSTMKVDEENYQVILDVQQFGPNEITVKTTDKYIVVEGKHEEKADEHGFISRHFVRRYQLPVGTNPNDISSSLSSDGVLTVTAPRKPLPPPNAERVVPITQTSGKKDESSSPKVEQSS